MTVTGSADAELQIIAKDARGLSVVDRATLREAAEAYQDVCRELAATRRALCEVHIQRQALGERVVELEARLKHVQNVWGVPSWMRFGS